MYTEEFTDYESGIKYYKFISPIGTIFSCHKIIDNKDVIITENEFDNTKIKTEKEFIKFLLLQFFKFENLMITVKPTEITTFINTNDEITINNFIKYYDVVETEINTFKFDEIETFIRYLFNNKISTTFIDHCIKEFSNVWIY